MSKRLILILALAFVVGISFAAYAEVQNVKVSGDLTVKAVYRNNFDLTKPATEGPVLPPAAGAVIMRPVVDPSTWNDKEQDFLSITRVRVDADLTDNVATTVRLINERNWGESTQTVTGRNNVNVGLGSRNPLIGAAFVPNAIGVANTRADENGVDIDLAYVTLKEFLYSPLTLTIGRQELHFGNDWIVGDPDTNGIALDTALAEGDLSARKSFDAVRATMDYKPLVIDTVYAKVSEGDVTRDDDLTLSGINAAYELNKETNLEGFFFSKVKGAGNAAVRNIDVANGGVAAVGTNANQYYDSARQDMFKDKADVVNTVGGRVVNKSIKNLTIDLSSAFQFGTYNPKFDPNARVFDSRPGNPLTKAETSQRRAWGLEAIATYDLSEIQKIAKYKPSISGAYVYLSGEDRYKTGDDTYRGWDPMFENQTFGHIINAIMGFSNVQLAGLSMQAKPVEDVGVKLDWVTAYLNKRYADADRMNWPAGFAGNGGMPTVASLSGIPTANEFNMGKTSFLGQEIDATVTYDYTEDVQFSLLGGIFLPGKSINEQPQTMSYSAPVAGMPAGGWGGGGPNGGTRTLQNRAAAVELIGSMKVTF